MPSRTRFPPADGVRPRPRGHLTLANRILALALVGVVFTTVLLAAVISAGVYQMAVQQGETRQAAYADLLRADITSRVNGALRVARVTGQRQPLKGSDVPEMRRALSASVVDAAQYFEGMAVLALDGTVTAEWPQGAVTQQEAQALIEHAGKGDTGPFVWTTTMTDAGALGHLWVAVSISMAESPRLLVAPLRMDTVDDVIARVGSSGRSVALVVDGSGAVLFGGFASADGTRQTLELSPPAAGSPVGAAVLAGPRDYAGIHMPIEGMQGPGWRVAVLEPTEIAMTETWGVLRPSLTAWGVALALSLIGALTVTRWVTGPLKDLERRARAVAAGAYIEPETVERTDEIGRLLEAFNSVTRRLNRLSDIAELLADASDRELVFDGVTSSIAHMLHATDVDLLLVTGDGRGLQLVSADGALQQRIGSEIPLSASPWLARALVDGEPIESSAGDEPLLGLHAADGERRGLAVPLRAGSDIVGLVAAVRTADSPFLPAELEMVRSFAAQASVALQNARLFDDERRSRREAETLRAVAERVAFPEDLEQTLEEVAQLAAELLGMEDHLFAIADRAAHGLYDSPTGLLGQRWLSEWEALPSDRAREAPRTTPLVIGEGCEARELLACVRSMGCSSALAVPLTRESAVIGLLVLTSSAECIYLNPRQLEIVETIGSQISLALQNAYLFEQARARADNLETVFRISQAVGSSLQSKVVLNRVMDVVQKILSADAVLLMTYDSVRKIMSVPMARGILDRGMLDMTLRPGEDIPGRVFETREPERFGSIELVDTELVNAAASQGLRSLLMVPLLARGRSIGVLAVFSQSEDAFSADDQELLATFASQAALAIDTANLFSREHRVATVLQESILPTRLPRLPGIDASSVYLPAGSEAEIGGDYYDLFETPDGRVALAIGDVCGKGVMAATKTSMIKYAIRGMVAAGLPPGRVLEELNVMLAAIGDPSSIVTAWLGYLDVGERRLTYANGGHPPALLLFPERQHVERLGTTGALLGAVGESSYAELGVSLEPSSVILLYTDGVTEARNRGKFFGEGRVRRALRQGGSAAMVTQRLLAMVQRFSGGELRDDAAILTVALEDSVPAEGVSRPEGMG